MVNIFRKNRRTLHIDHSMDGVILHPMKKDSLSASSISTISGRDSPPAYEENPATLKETPEERKARLRSHKVIYVMMFALGISISVGLNVWPYLHEELVPTAKKISLGWVSAASPLGQMLAAPLLGLCANKTGKIKPFCIFTVLLSLFGNIMYALLYAFKGLGEWAPYYALVFCRFIIGISQAVGTLCRIYLSSSTTTEECTSSLSMLSAFMSGGIVVGPIMQALFTLALPENIPSGVDWFVWNKYTASALLSAAMCFICLLLLSPCIFQEYNIAAKKRNLLKESRKEDEGMKLPKPDYLGLGGIFFSRFGLLFIGVLVETLMTPMVMDEYAWTENRAMVIMGISTSVISLLNVFTYGITAVIVKKFDERLVMILGGFLPATVGMFLFLPWGNGVIPMQKCDLDNVTMSTTTEATTDVIQLYDANYPSVKTILFSDNDPSDCTPGCPQSQVWCTYTPQLPEAQLFVAFFIAFNSFPVAQGTMLGIFSKLLGPKPQGVWQGLLSNCGSLARIIGPVVISYVYEEFGTRWCFGILTGVLTTALLELFLLFNHLTPMKVQSVKETHAYDGPAAENP
ncbi:major facilitator superfamily domain-containing protein 8-like isoform X1 [Homarus americanus]|uniref:major facilitator superfamily domain-containing protein 8-like isoform X1 n=1 Tax=Homarus americanus TaxID=6706 RepID=UPI001C4621BE|nr:major facilitator superfamily domain-containing protein 8-like isoform X1 [Homarus americanus]XP_042237115.1 major facilitator superfamily domain-containing protein 8-like isoform X1 [Homarus americanus]XP_042237116.1 major facilitator superfamily domain-containing protein 8-like isoform X1 [Homarus americanus]XP_042237117.1 major facilitator superfamily domain-containing protein 8-like isoform X1 [Homarus americanus]XP_042237118.1 major facilitator superfamily domain-containing protein 8-li